MIAIRKNGPRALQRMDNVGIVVESLDAAISFFAELGLELEGRDMIEGLVRARHWTARSARRDRPGDAHAGRPRPDRTLAMSRAGVVGDHRNAPVNALGLPACRVRRGRPRQDRLARLGRHGAQLVDEVVQYEDEYRLCYVRGPEGILIGLAEQIVKPGHALRRPFPKLRSRASRAIVRLRN